MKGFAFVAVASFLAVGEIPSAGAQQRVCIPGAQLECPCVGGTRSVQVCAADGMSLLPCQCGAAPMPPPAGAMTPAALTVPPTASAAPALMGSLDISAATPATISVDGGEVGRAPVHVGALQPGVHIVGAQFDGGGELRKKVRVGAGEATVIVVDPPMSATAGAWRRGLHLGGTVGPAWGGIQEDFEGAGPGLAAEFLVNYGLSPAFDVRFGGRLLLAKANAVIVVAGVPVSARFNLGSVFSMGVGVFTGVSSAYRMEWVSYVGETYPRETGLVGGLEAYPAIFRFGAKREIELGLGGAYLYHLTTENDVIHFGINVTYLLL